MMPMLLHVVNDRACPVRPARRRSRSGRRALMARDRALETWLQTEVAIAYDEAQSDPSSQVASSDVRARLEALHERTVKERS